MNGIKVGYRASGKKIQDYAIILFSMLFVQEFGMTAGLVFGGMCVILVCVVYYQLGKEHNPFRDMKRKLTR